MCDNRTELIEEYKTILSYVIETEKIGLGYEKTFLAINVALFGIMGLVKKMPPEFNYLLISFALVTSIFWVLTMHRINYLLGRRGERLRKIELILNENHDNESSFNLFNEFDNREKNNKVCPLSKCKTRVLKAIFPIIIFIFWVLVVVIYTYHF